jgi:hypothetical protein
MLSVANAPTGASSATLGVPHDGGLENLLDASFYDVRGMRQAADMSLNAVIGELQHQISGNHKLKQTHGATRLGGVAHGAPQLRAPAPQSSAALGGSNTPVEESSNGALMIWLVATLQEKGFQCSEDWLNTDLALYKKARESQNSLLAKSAKEVDERAAQAKKASHAMGCAQKVFGGVIVALSLVAGVITGGASLVLAGAALALFVADLATEAATGTSISSRVFRPIIDGVFTPIAKFMGDVATKALVGVGVDAETASLVGAALGAALAVIAIVAMFFVAKGPACKMASAVGGMIKNMVAKMVAKAAQGLAGKTGQALIAKVAQSSVGTAVKTSAAQVAKTSTSISRTIERSVEEIDVVGNGEFWAMQARNAMTICTAVNSGIQGGFGVYASAQEFFISKEIARQTENDLQKDLFENLLDRAIKIWTSFNGALQRELTKGLDVLQNEASVATFVASNVRLQSA